MTNRELLASETKKKLLDTGKKVIAAEKGFNNTSVEDITNACGVAKGTFYTYFKRKEDIVSGIMYEQTQDEMNVLKTINKDTPVVGSSENPNLVGMSFNW